MKARDMTAEKFVAACERHGFKPQGFLGYFNLGIEGHNVSASALNAGPRRRDQLAYLLAERRRVQADIATENGAGDAP